MALRNRSKASPGKWPSIRWVGPAVDEGIALIVTFLGSLKGEIAPQFIKEQALLENGPDTPAPSE
jgi:hypothetical protein